MSVFSDITDSIELLLQHSKKINPYYKSRLIQKLKAMDLYSAGDIIAYVPALYEDRRTTTPLANAVQEQPVLVRGNVQSHSFAILRRRGGRLLKITIADDSGTAELHCYGREFLQKTLPVGADIFVWGKFAISYGVKSSSAFEIITDKNRALAIVPRYKLYNRGISQAMFSLCVATVCAALKVSDIRPHRIALDRSSDTTKITRQEAIRMIHFPINFEEIEKARQYFAFDELLLFQISMNYARQKNANIAKLPPTVAIVSDELPLIKKENTTQKNMLQTLIKNLPFTLTNSQVYAINEIIHDMQSSSVPMRRILQGDVGSGKTLVALCCAMPIMERGQQVCFAVPSEALALQHFRTISAFCTPLGIEVVLLTGSISATARKKACKKIADGTVLCIVGTHAVYSRDVIYKSLQFVVVDEQHRFGIVQRSVLLTKGDNVHALLMSATPIPRSLALTVYSGMDISTIEETPKHQGKKHTKLILYKNSYKLYSYIKEKLDKGEQAFFVFPAIEEKRDDDIPSQKDTTSEISATALHPHIAKALHPHSVALLHSRIATKTRESILQDFADGKIAALVSTTIIEIGIDVPNATTMCVFDAQNFGLATLHQLRGRIGRGVHDGDVFFVYRKPLSDVAKERLKIIYEQSDGFAIAEQDLLLRGPGDVHQCGVRQSGVMLFLFFDMSCHKDIISHAHSFAREILQDDASLQKAENSIIRRHVINNADVLV